MTGKTRESLEVKRARAAEIVARLHEAYPGARCSLAHRSAFELLAATILSAQCTDERVNQVTPALFAAYPDAQSLAGARLEDVEALIRSTGFFRSKARSLVGMAGALVERHDGEVPAEMDALVKLPGVGRKTANVVLGNSFGKAVGVVVDTHVSRLSQRLGLTRERTPEKIEQDLMGVVAREEWTGSGPSVDLPRARGVQGAAPSLRGMRGGGAVPERGGLAGETKSVGRWR